MKLTRVSIIEDGAFGVLTQDDGTPICLTLERTYTDELSQYVKIPTGRLRCVKSRYNKGGYDSYEVIVPTRTEIKFHKGNVETESEGCILVGRRFGMLNNRLAVLDSALAFADFMAATNGVKEFYLDVA